MNPLQFVSSIQSMPQTPVKLIEVLANMHFIPEDYPILISVDCQDCGCIKTFRTTKSRLRMYNAHFTESELNSEFVSAAAIGIIFNLFDNDLLHLISQFRCSNCTLKKKGVKV